MARNEVVTFTSLQEKYAMNLHKAVSALASARTLEDVELAQTALKTLGKDYVRELKALLDELDLRHEADQQSMQDMMLDKFNFNPADYPLTYEVLGNTVRWTVTVHGREKYWFVSKSDTPVDMDRFFEWCLNILCI